MFNSVNRSQREAPQAVERTAPDNVVDHPARNQWVKKKTEACAHEFDPNFWQSVRKRHCESREHLRELLNKHVHPHCIK